MSGINQKQGLYLENKYSQIMESLVSFSTKKPFNNCSMTIERVSITTKIKFILC